MELEVPPEPQTDENAVDWKSFGILMFAGLLAALAVVPYLVDIISATGKEINVWELAASTVVEHLFLLAIAICLGLILCPKVGLRTPFLNNRFFGTPGRVGRGRSPMILALMSGVSIAVFIAIADPQLEALMPAWPESARQAERAAENMPAWKHLLASFSAGVTEELLFRFGLMTLLAWLGMKTMRRTKPGCFLIWIANLSAALMFSLAHLTNVVQLGIPITPGTILYVTITNGVPGVVFGWLYWRQGLSSAILAHVVADVTLRVVVPFVTTVFA